VGELNDLFRPAGATITDQSGALMTWHGPRTWLSQPDQAGVCGREATSLKVEVSEMVVKIDVEPLATPDARALDSDAYELSADSLSPRADLHDRVQDKCVRATVPGHVDKADEFVLAPRADPTEAMPAHLAIPVIIEKTVVEGLCM
jgi:hypothetical protein